MCDILESVWPLDRLLLHSSQLAHPTNEKHQRCIFRGASQVGSRLLKGEIFTADFPK